MRFLANENFPGAAIAALEAAGHDVVWARIAAPGTNDPGVLAWAAREERILLTFFDKDFGELARGSTLPRKCGVVLLRTPMHGPGNVGRRLADLITARDDWAGHFSVIEPAAFECDRSGSMQVCMSMREGNARSGDRVSRGYPACSARGPIRRTLDRPSLTRGAHSSPLSGCASNGSPSSRYSSVIR